jgi:signal transduction histidine kinase
MGITSHCTVVVDRFRNEINLEVLPIANDRGTIALLLERDHFLGSFAGPFAWSLLSRRPLTDWLALRAAPKVPNVIPLETQPAEAAAILAQASTATSTLVVVDGDGAYIGLLHERALLNGMLSELARARDAALAANEAKTMFLATMSHELRTPLNGILGLSDLLLHEPLTAAQHELCAAVRGSGQRIFDLVNQILDFTELESGQVQLQRRAFDPLRSLQGVVAVLGIQAARKGIRLLLTSDPALPPQMFGDEVRLRQVLVNLLDNALKFTTEGEVEINLLGTAEGRIRFTISDTGPGIEDRTLRRLFQPFIQADSTFTRSHEGSGLGLAISQRLVRLMGGEIAVSTRPGAGSTFSFTLPLT